MPKSGHNELIPAKRIDDALIHEVAPARHDNRRESTMLGYQESRPSGFHTDRRVPGT